MSVIITEGTHLSDFSHSDECILIYFQLNTAEIQQCMMGFTKEKAETMYIFETNVYFYFIRIHNGYLPNFQDMIIVRGTGSVYVLGNNCCHGVFYL